MIMQNISEAAAGRSTESALIVSFRLGSQQYSLPVAAVCEVVRLPALVTLVGAAPALCGLLNLRGLYIPVFDGRLLVGEAAGYDLSKQIVIVGHVRPELGVIVDQVHGVVRCGSLSSAPLARPLAGALIESVCEADHGSIIGISLTALLALAAEAAPVAPVLAD
jgi:purine-binding chemotaxis protein CheW